MGSLSIESIDDGLTYVSGPPIRLRAYLATSGAATADVTSIVTWTADLPVVTVATGVVTAAAPGVAVVRAELDGRIGTFDVRVTGARALFTTTFNGNVATYAPDVNGPAQPLRTLVLIGSLQSIWADASELYVVDGSTVSIYPVATNGNVMPTRRIFPKISGTAMAARSMRLSNGELFATDSGGRLAVFPASAQGNTEPTRLVTNGGAQSTGWGGFVIVGNEVILLQADGIDAIPTDATGPTTPLRSIQGPSTGITGAAISGLAASDTELFVARRDTGEVMVFPLAGTGDIPPTRTISGFPTGTREVWGPMFVGNELYVPIYDPVKEGEIWVFDPGASGPAMPSRKSILFLSPGTFFAR